MINKLIGAMLLLLLAACASEPPAQPVETPPAMKADLNANAQQGLDLVTGQKAPQP